VADIVNRSPFVVDIESGSKANNLAHLRKQFAFKHQAGAVAYAAALVKAGHAPRITQLETSFQVRIRSKGSPAKVITFATLAEADQCVSKIDSDRKLGLLRDYTQGAQTTTVELIERYIKEECPGLKGGATYATILNAMVEDSSNKLRQRIEQRKREMREHGRFITPLGANREPMTALEWLHLPLTKVRPEHFHDFIRDRLEYVEGATVDRQLDLLSRIYTLAQTRWRIHLDVSPMLGIKRPSYFNERDRRLVGDEEQRLLEAARKEDQLRSLDMHVEMLAADDVAAARALGTHYAVNAARKAAYERAREQAIATGFPHIPLFEAFVNFQLATAARRGESLGLHWTQINREAQLAAMPTSKNGRPRKLALRGDIIELLDLLPRDGDLVFDIGIKELSKAWRRICTAAGVEDLHIHDLRHEGISRAAESGLFPTVLDLQAFSGHREIRSLSRYTHLCMTAIARKLEEAEAKRRTELGHKGRQRLKTSELMWLGGAAATAAGMPDDASARAPAAPEPASNVVRVRFGSDA
jgi:integrase